MRGIVRRLSAVITAAVITACSSPTSPDNVRAHLADWKARGIVNYDYTYEIDGGFFNGPHGPVRVEVRQDTVRSVILLADSTTLDPRSWPTIDALFNNALGAAHDGSLARITFDPVLAYPTLIQFDVVPDRVSALRASDLQTQP
ncbi:MAG TPA: DUF6174 domain-containing protein [Gemmatimonadales bacterium]|jgi:hypothetical protein|nr:DUF6174 domain-containing protein [Gemmatimonadales bacterium]